MPPEQAMGGEVTPRSDLYSLGAMVYELVTGRPPFIGDESVAIITQHLNTPPVAPSWHVPDLPPGLEALVLRLLEKDPSKRPESAGAVRTALAGVRPSLLAGEAEAHPTAVVGAAPLLAGGSPTYRRTFVGREHELGQLQRAFDAALGGEGALAMVVGEPGIGKTSVCEQLATYVAMRGGRALVGHCYEEGSLSLPYLPFVEAMRSYVLAREPDGLRKDLGSGAAEVARLISEIGERLPVELRAPGDPEDDRWRLLQAVSDFLRNASTVQPLLIVLEDLHDADRGTLDLLVHLSRGLPGARLLIVGTYRDVEVDRSHPLSNTLAELRRPANFLRVALRGLTVDEVQRMMTIVRGQEVPWSRAEAIHRQTEGNPLFVQEVLRYLVEEGIVVREDGRYVLSDPQNPDAGIPEGLRDVVGKRLSRLSQQANAVLSIASVIGREFRLDILQRVAGLPEEELYAALEDATERAVVEQRQSVGIVRFRFTHAFFRQTLYEEIFVPRRIRLHQQVGKALEEVYGKRLDEHAAELAEHFVQSTETGDLEKALRYS
jgi:eukaryotic-like serine/threonine-protein kinase